MSCLFCPCFVSSSIKFFFYLFIVAVTLGPVLLMGQTLGLSHESETLQKAFGEVYRQKAWGSEGNGSGPGSSERQTKAFSKYLVLKIQMLNIQSFLDIPCGGMFWMPKVLKALQMKGHRVQYFGMDVVSHLIEQHKKTFAFEADWTFDTKDMTTAQFDRRFDLILSRDVMFHLTERSIKCSLNNFIRSNSTYLLSTSTPGYKNSELITWTPQHLQGKGKLNDGSYRPVDLSTHPYNLGPPEDKVDEINGKDQRIVGLWNLRKMKLFLDRHGQPLSCVSSDTA